MKIRTRNYRQVGTAGNFWTSFTDIMTTVSLVFFFIMLVSISVVYIKYQNIKNTYDLIDDIALKRKQLYEEVEKTLKPKLEDNISFNDGKLEIKTEVLFNTDKYELTSQGSEIATQVSEAFFELLEKEDYRNKIASIEVRGHTDNSYRGDYNRFLSTNRASSFLNAMIPDGNKYEKYAEYFKASGMSKYYPKAGDINSQNDEQQMQNRRIEIYINLKEDDIADAINKLIKSNKK